MPPGRRNGAPPGRLLPRTGGGRRPAAILPLARPGLVAVALFTFLIAWNSYVWALVLTTDSSMFVLSVGIANMVGEYRVQWNELMADPEQKISRPRQIYLGEGLRKVTTHSKAADAIAVKHKDAVVAG